jgi:hypothetical protein
MDIVIYKYLLYGDTSICPSTFCVVKEIDVLRNYRLQVSEVLQLVKH